MLDKVLKREDVKKLLKELCNNNRYYEKTNSNSINYKVFVGPEQVLFLFYDALFKYEIIINDIYYFDDYIVQLDKLFKKIGNIQDIGIGINKILSKICALRLNIKDTENEKSKREILEYLYDKYVLNGYLIHGYSKYYYEKIAENGVFPEEYINLYDKFIEVQDILKKYGEYDILDKDFSKKEICFTDNMVMGCYYASNAPMYFYNLICNNKYVTKQVCRSGYMRKDYDECLKNLQKLSYKLELNEDERNILYDTFNSQWKLLDKSIGDIGLILVPRKLIADSIFSINDIKDNISELSLGEIFNKILSSNSDFLYTDFIDKDDIVFISLPGYKDLVDDDKEKDSSNNQEEFSVSEGGSTNISDVSGKVSVLLLLGSIFITLGVIITMIMVNKGM